GDVMLTPDEVSAMVRLHELGCTALPAVMEDFPSAMLPSGGGLPKMKDEPRAIRSKGLKNGNPSGDLREPPRASRRWQRRCARRRVCMGAAGSDRNNLIYPVNIRYRLVKVTSSNGKS